MKGTTIRNLFIFLLIILTIPICISIIEETPWYQNLPEPIEEIEPTLEELIHNDINKYRNMYGLPNLTMIPEFNNIAKEQSTRMLKRQLMYHSNAALQNLGENVAKIPKGNWVLGCFSTLDNEGMADCATRSWMNSPGHKKNILDTQYKMTGINAQCDNENCWITQNFR